MFYVKPLGDITGDHLVATIDNDGLAGTRNVITT